MRANYYDKVVYSHTCSSFVWLYHHKCIARLSKEEKFLFMQDGLGDTIRVSLTEPPEEEIDPCRRLANLGKRAAELQQGVVHDCL